MQPHGIGDMIFFWTGRGSYGYGTIVRLTEGRVFISPEPDANKGSDWRILRSGAQWWLPRNRGLPRDHIDTPPRFWFTNF